MARMPKPWFRNGRGWFVTLEGKQHNLGREKKAAFQEYHRLMRQPVERRSVSGQSLAAIVDDFLDWVQRDKSPHTYRWYRDLLQKFMKGHADLRVDDLRPFHVQRWVDSYPTLSRTSRRNHLRSVKRCMKWAMQQGYIERNPVQYLEVPAAERRELIVREPEYREILRLAQPDAIRELIQVTWETGCRPQESLRVEARHVDLPRQRWIIPASEAKGEKITRIVYLTDEALLITRRLMQKHPEGKLFRNTAGAPWSSDAVNCAFDRIRIRMGRAIMLEKGIEISTTQIDAFAATLCPVQRSNGREIPKSKSTLRCEAKRKLTNRLATELAPRYSLYAFRHTWATRALEQGLDSVTVGVLLGHTDPSMLAKVYQHLAQNPVFLLEQAKKATTKA